MSRPQPMPLDRFPAAARERIEYLVAQPTPPPKWLDLPLAQIVSRAWTEWYRQRGLDPHRLRENVKGTLRAQVIARDGLVCQLCGGDVPPNDVHIDHRTPVSLGGRNVLGNLQVAHSRCNMRKGNRVEGAA